MSLSTPSGSAPPQPFTLALRQQTPGLETSVRSEWARATEKALRPLGYEIIQWQLAIGMLQRRHLKQRLPAGLSAFLDRWLPKDALPQPPDRFALILGEDEQGVHLHDSSLPFAADPAWWSLLHLPALREAWQGDLRGSQWDHLLKIVPQAWTIDPAPMVPGTEIGGLGLGSWAQSAKLHAGKRTFELRRLDGAEPALVLSPTVPAGEWTAAFEEALRSRDRLLIEVPHYSNWWLAVYETQADQWLLKHAYAARRGEADWVFERAFG